MVSQTTSTVENTVNDSPLHGDTGTRNGRLSQLYASNGVLKIWKTATEHLEREVGNNSFSSRIDSRKKLTKWSLEPSPIIPRDCSADWPRHGQVSVPGRQLLDLRLLPRKSVLPARALGQVSAAVSHRRHARRQGLPTRRVATPRAPGRLPSVVGAVARNGQPHRHPRHGLHHRARSQTRL